MSAKLAWGDGITPPDAAFKRIVHLADLVCYPLHLASPGHELRHKLAAHSQDTLELKTEEWVSG
jgi:hypothetical protein